MIYFFFQAEDGIRDYKVTGVQTCALPISERDSRSPVGPGTGCPHEAPPRVRQQSCRWRCTGTCRSMTASRHRIRSEEHTSELQSPCNLVCRLLLEKKKTQRFRGDASNSRP